MTSPLVHEENSSIQLTVEETAFLDRLLTAEVARPPSPSALEPVPPLEGTVLREPDFFNSGRFSDIYKGIWTRPDETQVPVAIKLLRDLGQKHRLRNEKRMLREAALWQKTRHPHIIPFYGVKVEKEGKELMLVSQLCENGNLREYTESHPKLTLLDKLRLLFQAGLALAWLHQLQPHRIFHGDIAMENILVLDNGDAALCDFGVSHAVHDMNVKSGLTASSPGGKGTKGFQAPEILLDVARPSGPADVYAFGGLILALLSGANPFHKLNNDNKVVLQVTSGRRPLLADHPLLPEADIWYPVLLKCWAQEPEDRLTMDDVVIELKHSMERQRVAPVDSTSAK